MAPPLFSSLYLQNHIPEENCEHWVLFRSKIIERTFSHIWSPPTTANAIPATWNWSRASATILSSPSSSGVYSILYTLLTSATQSPYVVSGEPCWAIVLSFTHVTNDTLPNQMFQFSPIVRRRVENESTRVGGHNECAKLSNFGASGIGQHSPYSFDSLRSMRRILTILFKAWMNEICWIGWIADFLWVLGLGLARSLYNDCDVLRLSIELVELRRIHLPIIIASFAEAWWSQRTYHRADSLHGLDSLR